MPRRCVLLVLVLLVPGCLGLSPFEPAGPYGDARVLVEAVRFDTDEGTFVAVVYPQEAPETVDLMRRLAASGYYNGRSFGRVIPGFVIQEVDLTGGTTDQTEHVPLEADARAMFSAGALGIARDEHPDSGGSEFFVMDFATSRLHGNYTVWGQVVEGMDVVRRIARVPAIETGPAAGVGAPPGSPAYFGIHDRIPLDPVEIRRASFVNLSLPLREAARLPLVVGETVAEGRTRATLEWPADVAAGRTSSLTWYLYTPPSEPMPDMTRFRVEVAGPRGSSPVATSPDPLDPRVVTFSWVFGAAGEYVFTLTNGTFTARTAVVAPPAG